MIKQNKKKLIISSLIIVLPIIIGLLLWDSLPSQMNIHWGADGNPDASAGKAFAVFVLPLILLVLHYVCIFITLLDSRNKDQSKKAIDIVFWIMPFVSLFSCALVYSAAFKLQISITIVLPILLALMFIIIGNYLPKCKQNYTLGIKVKWTLENEENWNATHRFAGKVWTIGGILFMLCIFLPPTALIYVLFAIIILLAAIPITYSYLYYKKQVKAGTNSIDTPLPKSQALFRRVSLCIALIILLLCAFFMFSGSIEIKYGDTSFTIEASYWEDLAVNYDAIDEISYQEAGVPGFRTFGFGSARLQLGAYENEEYGAYTRYTYTSCDACVILHVDGKILVINGSDEVSTQAIYETIATHQ